MNPRIGFVVLASALSACTAVTVVEPVGEPLKADLSEKVNGLWTAGDDSFFYVRFSTPGVLRIGTIEPKERGELGLNRTDVQLTEFGEATYAAVGVEAPGADHALFRFKLEDDGTAILWRPDDESFEKAIAEGALKGEVVREKHSKSVHVRVSKAELERFFREKGPANLFRLDDPAVLIRRTVK